MIPLDKFPEGLLGDFGQCWRCHWIGSTITSDLKLVQVRKASEPGYHNEWECSDRARCDEQSRATAAEGDDRMSMMDAIDIEEIGELADTADNFLVYATDAMGRLPMDNRIDALNIGLTKIRDHLRALYITGGGDPATWDTAAEEPTDA